MINFFATGINEEMTSKECCESKHYYILYKLAISVGIELDYELQYKNSYIVVITKKKGNIYACKSIF